MSGPPPPRIALFTTPFRPLFLLAAGFGVVIVPAWLVIYTSVVPSPVLLAPVYWHAHEMVFGYAAAVVAGFLLTAAANWTGRPTITGAPLAGLCLIWIAGRAVHLVSLPVPDVVLSVVSLAFLPAVALAVGRVVVALGSRRNYGLVVVLALLWGAQLAMHLGALGIAPEWLRSGALLGVDLIMVLILVIGGRVIPLFTRNATGATDIRVRPWLDRATLLAAAAVIGCDLVGVAGAGLVAATSAAAVLSAWRAGSWGVRHTVRAPLLWVLHVGYAFVPIGLALRAVAVGAGVPSSPAWHALTVGAIGVLTLGMMARVTLGHTGRPLVAGWWLGSAFALMVGAAGLRVVVGAAPPSWSVPLLTGSGVAWSVALAMYLVRLAPALVGPRPDGKPG